MKKKKIGFALCGSFCTFSKAIAALEDLAKENEVTPIMSYNARFTDTRFGKSEEIKDKLEAICSKSVICSLSDAEPIGPKKLFDLLIVAPCTGNTLGKLANGITDTPVTLACKSHLRNGRPVLIGVSTNDALGAASKNIGLLLNCKNIYFVPMGQDDCGSKPNSVVCDFSQIKAAASSALSGKQQQPLYICQDLKN